MARAKTTKAAKTLFFCTVCGSETPRWEGQCPSCRAWNSLVEAPRAGSGVRRTGSDSTPGRLIGTALPLALADVERDAILRFSTGIQELDFVLGGGLVPGSIILLGGEPGIGKSTL